MLQGIPEDNCVEARFERRGLGNLPVRDDVLLPTVQTQSSHYTDVIALAAGEPAAARRHG